MKKLLFSKRKTFLSCITGLLVFSIVLAPISQTLEITWTNAESVTVDGGNGTVQETITAGAAVMSAASNAVSAAADSISAAAESALVTKEYIFDNIAWMLVNIVIKEMIRSTTKWVNSGFKGSPAFVTDMEGFLLDIADKVAGNFIYGGPLRGLCSPFRLNIQLALDIQYKATRGYQAMCRLSSVIKDIDSFLAGDFLQGGWNGWYSVTLTPSNNPYGAMLEAQSALYANIGSSQGNEVKLLDFGKGFLSKRECAIDVDGSTYCSVTTPGTTIENQLNSALNLPAQRLAVADELNELIGALLGQLAGEVLGGVGGLLGLTETRSGGYGNYFDRVSADNAPAGVIQAARTPGSAEIESETKYRDLQKSMVDLITDARTYKLRTYGTDEAQLDENGNDTRRACRATGELTGSLTNQLQSAQRGVASSTALIATLSVFANDYTLLTSASTTASTTSRLLLRYGATSVPEAQNKLMQQFFQYQTSGAIHTIPQIITLEQSTLPALRTEIQSFTGSIDTACAQRSSGSSTYDPSPI